MNVSKAEQRTLHALAQGGRILIERDQTRKIVKARCVTRDGWVLSDCSLATFKKLKRRRLIRSTGGGPYRITRDGLVAVRPQVDNR